MPPKRSRTPSASVDAPKTPKHAKSNNAGAGANGKPTATPASAPGTKRKARASTADLDVVPSDGILQSAIKVAKRPRSGSQPPGKTRGVREAPAYMVRLGINPLPAPIPPISRAVLEQRLAVDITTPTASHSENRARAEPILKKGGLLKRDVFVFGNGDMGQHGLGTDALDEIKRPRLHAWVAGKNAHDKLGDGGLEMVAAGGMHTLTIDSTGRILSWGINDNAALGRRTTRDLEIEAEVFETEPMPVEGLSPTGYGVLGGPAPQGGKEGEVEKFRATRVAAGDSVSIALSDRGEVRVWGSFRSNDGLLGFNGEVGSDRTQFLPVALPALTKHSFVQVACGDDHVLALSTQGIVYTWGNGQQAQLGRRIIERRKINGLTPERLSLKNVVTIGAGAYHSFAVDKNGKVYAWGLNSLKQTGINTNEDIIPVPTEVEGLSPAKLGGAKVIQISAGQHHSLFLLSDGRVFGTGRCDGFELGIDDSHPAMQAVLKARREWSARRDEELKVEVPAWEKRMGEKKRRAEEAAKAGGGSSMDMVASEEDMPPRKGPPPDEYVAEPVHIPFSISNQSVSNGTATSSTRIVQLACGARHNLAVAADGTAYSWGFGVSSQLGQGDEEQIEVPTPVKSKQLAPFRSVACAAGGQHSLLLAVRSEE